MKKHLAKLFVIPLILLMACQGEDSLTEAQKTSVVSEVKEQYRQVMSDLSKLDIDIWSEPWSEEGFISVNSETNYFSQFTTWRDSVEYWFSFRETQEVEIVALEVIVFSSELALLTSSHNWEIQLKNGEHIKSKALGSLIWKKEKDGWKIVFLHESWQ